MSVASIAGIASPIFFGAVYAWTVQPGMGIAMSGLSFYIASAILLAGAIIGWIVAKRASALAKAQPASP